MERIEKVIYFCSMGLKIGKLNTVFIKIDLFGCSVNKKYICFFVVLKYFYFSGRFILLNCYNKLCRI